MNADGCIQIGIGGSHDDRHRAAGRQTCYIDASRIDVIGIDNFPRDAGNQRRLTLVALLIDCMGQFQHLFPLAREVCAG